ncbi:hypothetical protein D9758_008550 [Tetrapyrgos nigripes]|uniref:Uncharacterized protein n=1 Tax=Tetrapyrgos nigripes TaxID=182062 RepID=A0A8H5LIH4_9AGAR|nr:hypothetical protein D9758_008550 [Tetrapyrgos nigripes]
MSVVQPLLPSTATTRKRTSSFSCSSTPLTTPRPLKAQRTGMGSLRRTHSYLCLTDLQTLPSSSSSLSGSSGGHCAAPISSARTTPRQCKGKRERRKLNPSHSEAVSATRLDPPITIPSPPSTPPPKPIASTPKPVQYPAHTASYRISSPLSPVRTVLPARPVFPRSKHEPDLYKQAITTNMRSTPEGQKILYMGPRLALSIMTATKELELIVASQPSHDSDVIMYDATSTNSNPPNASWVIVPSDDWEMVDCISA